MVLEALIRIVITATVLLALLFGAGWIGWNWRGARCEAAMSAAIQKAQAAQAAALAKEQRKSDQKGAALENRIATQKETLRTLNEKLEDEIAKHSVYQQCRPTDGGLQSWIDAAAAR